MSVRRGEGRREIKQWEREREREGERKGGMEGEYLFSQEASVRCTFEQPNLIYKHIIFYLSSPNKTRIFTLKEVINVNLSLDVHAFLCSKTNYYLEQETLFNREVIAFINVCCKLGLLY